MFTIEPELENQTKILYVLYPEHSDDPNSKWRIQCVPEGPDSFANRRSLPEAWRGVRDAELSKVTGIPGEYRCGGCRWPCSQDGCENPILTHRACIGTATEPLACLPSLTPQAVSSSTPRASSAATRPTRVSSPWPAPRSASTKQIKGEIISPALGPPLAVPVFHTRVSSVSAAS